MGLDKADDILDPNEMRYIESFGTIVIDDPNHVEAITQRLRAGSYLSTGRGLMKRRCADVICFSGEKHLLSFADYVDTIVTQDGHLFQYTEAPLRFEDIVPEVHPFTLRRRCAGRLYKLGISFVLMSEAGEPWPSPNEWSDAIFEKCQGFIPAESLEVRKYIAREPCRVGRAHRFFRCERYRRVSSNNRYCERLLCYAPIIGKRWAWPTLREFLG